MASLRRPIALWIVFLVSITTGACRPAVADGTHVTTTTPLRASAQDDTARSVRPAPPFDNRIALTSTAHTIPKESASLSTILLFAPSISRPETQFYPRVAVGLTSSFHLAWGLLVPPDSDWLYFDVTPKMTLGASETWAVAVDAQTAFLLDRDAPVVEKGPASALASPPPHRDPFTSALTWTIRSQPQLLATAHRGRVTGSLGAGVAVAVPGIGAEAQVYSHDETSAALTASIGGAVHLHPELALVSSTHVYAGLRGDGRGGPGPWAVDVDKDETIFQSRSGLRFSAGPYALGVGVILRDVRRRTSDPAALSYLRLRRTVFGESE